MKTDGPDILEEGRYISRILFRGANSERGGEGRREFLFTFFHSHGFTTPFGSGSGSGGTSDWFGLGGQASGCAFSFLSFCPVSLDEERRAWVLGLRGFRSVVCRQSFLCGRSAWGGYCVDGMLFLGGDGAMGTVSSGRDQVPFEETTRLLEMVYSGLRSSRKCISWHLTKAIAHERIEKRFIYFAVVSARC